MNEVKKLFFSLLGINSESENKYYLNEFPLELRKYFLTFVFFSICVFAVNIFILIQSSASAKAMISLGFIIFFASCVYTFLLYVNFRYQKYITVSGTCQSSEWVNWTKKYVYCFIQNSQGDLFRVTLSKSKGMHIKAGDIVDIYVNNESSIYKQDGMYIVNQYYTTSRIPINKNIAS